MVYPPDMTWTATTADLPATLKMRQAVKTEKPLEDFKEYFFTEPS
jgi:hypothetical protein